MKRLAVVTVITVIAALGLTGFQVTASGGSGRGAVIAGEIWCC